MDIQVVSNNYSDVCQVASSLQIQDLSKLSEVRTTVDLANLHLRAYDQNIIHKIEWVYWAGEIQGFVTLTDGATLLFEDTLANVAAVNEMKIGDHLEISNHKNGSYLANGRLLALYTIDDNFKIFP